MDCPQSAKPLNSTHQPLTKYNTSPKTQILWQIRHAHFSVVLDAFWCAQYPTLCHTSTRVVNSKFVYAGNYPVQGTKGKIATMRWNKQSDAKRATQCRKGTHLRTIGKAQLPWMCIRNWAASQGCRVHVDDQRTANTSATLEVSSNRQANWFTSQQACHQEEYQDFSQWRTCSMASIYVTVQFEFKEQTRWGNYDRGSNLWSKSNWPSRLLPCLARHVAVDAWLQKWVSFIKMPKLVFCWPFCSSKLYSYPQFRLYVKSMHGRQQ